MLFRSEADGVRTADQLVQASLEQMGFLQVSEDTLAELLVHARQGGNLDWSDKEAAGKRVGEVLALVGATTEYQFG